MDRWGSLLALALASSLMAGCACRQAAISPRLSLGSDAVIAAVAAARAIDPDTLQLQMDAEVRGRTSFGRQLFKIAMLWRRPDDLRLSVIRPDTQTRIADIFRDGDTLTLDLPLTDECYRGAIGDLDPAVLQRFPLDGSALAAAPLIDARLAARAPSLTEVEPPRWSCWRRHRWLQGEPTDAADPWWRGFAEERWALRGDTLTVESVALRLPPAAGERTMWLQMTFEDYQPFDIGADGETAVLPHAFRLSLVRHPWRRWLRGEAWSVAGEMRAIRLDHPIRDRVFQWRPSSGRTTPPRPLSDLRLR